MEGDPCVRLVKITQIEGVGLVSTRIPESIQRCAEKVPVWLIAHRPAGSFITFGRADLPWAKSWNCWPFDDETQCNYKMPHKYPFI